MITTEAATRRAQQLTSIAMVDENGLHFWEVVHHSIVMQYASEDEAQRNYDICIAADIDELQRTLR